MNIVNQQAAANRDFSGLFTIVRDFESLAICQVKFFGRPSTQC